MGSWKSDAVIQIDQRILVVHQVDVLRRVPVHHDQVQLTLPVVLRALIRVDLHHDHQDQIQIDGAKIYQHAVVHHLELAHQEKIAKAAMSMIRAEFAPPQWIAINHDYAQEFLNLTFRKKLQVKNLRKLLAQSY